MSKRLCSGCHNFPYGNFSRNEAKSQCYGLLTGSEELRIMIGVCVSIVTISIFSFSPSLNGGTLMMRSTNRHKRRFFVFIILSFLRRQESIRQKIPAYAGMTFGGSNMKKKLTGGQAIMESLLHEGADVIFGYPGGAIMPTYDALYDYREKIRHILVRHEQGAGHAAQGY